MPAEFTRLHERFDVLAEQLTAPGRIDIDRALAEGRRARARRRAKYAGVAVVTVAATAALALTATNLLAAPDRTRQIVPTTPAPPRTATDPFAVGASFGWLPTGMRAEGYSTQQNGKQGSTIVSVSAETGGPDSPVLGLSAAPAGPRPTLPLTVYPVETPAFTAGPSINGHKSFVEYYPGDDPWPANPSAEYYLMWQFDDGAWAILDAGSPQSPLSEAEVVHAARTVTEKPYPIPQSFQIDGPLAAADVVSATFAISADSKLTLRAGDAEIDITVGTIEIAGQSCKTGPNPGIHACVAVRGTLPPSLAKTGVRGVLGDITLLQFPTTDVIR